MPPARSIWPRSLGLRCFSCHAMYALRAPGRLQQPCTHCNSLSRVCIVGWFIRSQYSAYLFYAFAPTRHTYCAPAMRTRLNQPIRHFSTACCFPVVVGASSSRLRVSPRRPCLPCVPGCLPTYLGAPALPSSTPVLMLLLSLPQKHRWVGEGGIEAPRLNGYRFPI